MKNSMEIPQKIKNRVTTWSSNPTSGYIFNLDLLVFFSIYKSNSWHFYSKDSCVCASHFSLKKAPESPLDKEIKPVNLKGNQLWILVGQTDAEAEAPVFWSSDESNWLIRKVPDAGKDWGQKEKRASEVEMAGWHHWSNGHELGQTWGDGEGQGGLVCCSPWGCKESDMTGRLNNNILAWSRDLGRSVRIRLAFHFHELKWMKGQWLQGQV